MRSKYIIRGEGEERFGIRYDRKKEECVFGCPKRFIAVANSILELYFQVDSEIVTPVIAGSRARWTFELNLIAWMRAVSQMRKNMSIHKAVNLGRLLR